MDRRKIQISLSWTQTPDNFDDNSGNGDDSGDDVQELEEDEEKEEDIPRAVSILMFDSVL